MIMTLISGLFVLVVLVVVGFVICSISKDDLIEKNQSEFREWKEEFDAIVESKNNFDKCMREYYATGVMPHYEPHPYWKDK